MSILSIGSKFSSRSISKKRTPITKIKVANFDAMSLWDSGAECSLISRSLYDKLTATRKCIHFPTSRIIIKSASRDELKVLATISCELTMGKIKREGLFHVIPQLTNCDVLFGSDFMQKNNVILNLGRRSINIGPIKPSPKTNDYTIQNLNKLCIEPKTERLIYLVDKNPSTGLDCLVENITLYPGIKTMTGLTTKTMINGQLHVPCVLANITNDRICVKPKAMTWEITPRDEITVCKVDLQQDYDKNLRVKRRSDAQSFVEQNADLSHIDPTIRPQLLNMLESYSDVFSRNHLDIGHAKTHPHVIKLQDPSKIVNIPPYRSPHFLQEIQHDYVDQLLAANVIRASTSPFSSPLMMIKKANADINLPLTSHYRVVHNYKRVNETIVSCSYPLSNLYELIDEVSQGKYFTVLDLSQGYFNQECIDPHGATAFTVPGRGTYEYLRSPMGTKSSPSYFQRLMEFVLRNLKNVYVYLDDIIVSTASLSDHLIVLEKVLKRLRFYNLKINLRKAHFG